MNSHLPIACVFLFSCITVAVTVGQDVGYVGAPQPTTASEIYGQGVRETDWQSPAAEQAGFHLPPGFRIELFASEPQIAKPLNMAWDARGRLWVTSSREYPYPAVGDAAPRDTLQILEDTDGDGRADQSTTFAEGLNIPMGVLPVAQGAICFSIPNLWLLRDIDGDDRADERIKILGPFDTSRDTHGMINSLSRGADGWIYACHGFNNQSDITAADGSRVQLTSGNTFRFREDGSRVELFTQGQVNPFGMTRDEWGNWYSADCHSKPLTALLHGACYPSFGRPHDGLGFGPAMMTHLHGSTAICGLHYYQAEQFPSAYRQLFYSGNVMTSRINCNAVQHQGSTVTAHELPDFMTSDDPWFRPVDIQLGADGALYVADFYNKIIGHYEVPLEHPGRDRDSGRIWKIYYAGDASTAEAPGTEQGPRTPGPLRLDGQLLSNLASSNITRRRLAVELAMVEESLPSVSAASILNEEGREELLRMSCLEVLFRRGRYDLTHSRLLGTNSEQPRLSVQQLLQATELPPESRNAFAALVRGAFPDRHPQAKRAACRLLGIVGDIRDVELLAEIAVTGGDPALSHVARIALKNVVSDDRRLAAAADQVADTSAEDVLAQVLPAVDSELSAQLLLEYVAAQADAPAALVEAATLLATKHASDPLLLRLLEVVQHTHAADPIAQAEQLEKICDAYLAKHSELPELLSGFGTQLQFQLVEKYAAHQAAHGPDLVWRDATGSDWALETRAARGGAKVKLRSSLTRGETYTGALVSEAFQCPVELRFLLAGHNGLPSQPDTQRNKVELQSAATGSVLQTAYPPRRDAAAPIHWSLGQHAGQAVRLVVTDGDAGKAYAWLAVGQFSLPTLNAQLGQDLLASYMGLVRRGFSPIDPGTAQRLQLGPRQRAELVAAGLQGAGSITASDLASWAIELNRLELVPETLLAAHSVEDLFPLAKHLALSITSSQQRKLADELVRTADGCRLLERLLAEGAMPAHSLPRADVLWPSGLESATRAFLETQREQAAAQQLPTEVTATRIAGLDWSSGDVAQGQQLYQQHCANCHQLRGKGAVVGPQLDGAVVRGVERLCEDLLEPNLNVDKAFRISAVLLDDDTVLSGLLRDAPDGVVVLTGQDGKSQQFQAERIAQRRDTTQSLMPSNFGELLSDQQLISLMAYLMQSGQP